MTSSLILQEREEEQSRGDGAPLYVMHVRRTETLKAAVCNKAAMIHSSRPFTPVLLSFLHLNEWKMRGLLLQEKCFIIIVVVSAEMSKI